MKHPDEGHISKSIKQVYASMWNFRAFDERDFYRVDHFITSMGVLCHPNFSNLAENKQLVMDDQYLDEIRTYLNVIHNEFKILYQAENASDFAMEIEYKITSDDRLSIKQARPWAGF